MDRSAEEDWMDQGAGGPGRKSRKARTAFYFDYNSGNTN